MSSERTLGKTAAEYRRGYLKYRTVLHDRATGLPAFPVLIDRLRTELDSRRRIGLLHVEIVHLDQVESLYGWQVVDRILRRAADALKATRGNELPEHALAAIDRVAGQGLIVFLLEGADGDEVNAAWLSDHAQVLRGALEQALREEAEFVGVAPRLAVRAGHALLSHDPFVRFERSVYAALREARAYDRRREQRRERSRGEDLQRIIRDSAVETLFQPVVDLNSRDVLGHEAFARGPRDSALESPQAMFALGSRVGVEADLDRACRDAALRASAGISAPGKLFLNTLPFGLADDGRATDLAGETDLGPEDLVLEFSERGAEQDPERFAAVLSNVKAQGYGVALDDVGTGFASQSILERIRPDYLKLDVSLVHEIDRQLIKQELLCSVVRIAEQIGAGVIAEGVERNEEAAVVREAGARFGQGRLFAAPAPAEAMRG